MSEIELAQRLGETVILKTEGGTLYPGVIVEVVGEHETSGALVAWIKVHSLNDRHTDFVLRSEARLSELSRLQPDEFMTKGRMIP